MEELEFSDIAQSVCFPRAVLTENTKYGFPENTSKPNDLANKRRPWLTGPLPLSCEGCRFELPMDLKVLENLSGIKYLSHYCIVSSRRKYLFKTIFIKADKDLDGIINSYELRQALVDLYSNSIDDECLDDILDIIDCKMESVFDRKQFLAVSAFSERYLCTRYQDRKVFSNSKHLLEQTDFAGLRSKLESYNIASNLVRMLLII